MQRDMVAYGFWTILVGLAMQVTLAPITLAGGLAGRVTLEVAYTSLLWLALGTAVLICIGSAIMLHGLGLRLWRDTGHGQL